MSENLAQIIYDNYPNTDLLPIDREEDCSSLQALFLKVTEEDVGDTLFKFIVIEAFEAGTDEEAIRLLNRGIDDLRAVIRAIPE